jgi:flagellar biosynthesis protein FliR
VIPAGFAWLEQSLLIWMIAMIRPGAAFVAAPIFGAPQVPVQLRLIIALAIGVPSAGLSAMSLPADGIVSIAGLLMIVSEVLIGLAMGFAVQTGFAATLIAGEAISNTMGIGFAAMASPITGQSSPAIGQFLSMLATFLFLASNGHLMLVQTIAESYAVFAPGQNWLSAAALLGLVKLGSSMFAAGVAIALPVGFAMLLVQILMGMIARSAPALNLFSVGMPATLLAGVILLAMATPVLSDTIMAALQQSFDAAKAIARG